VNCKNSTNAGQIERKHPLAIFLRDLFPLQNVGDYKLHFARSNNIDQPLEVFSRDRREWQGWQEYRPARDDFNRPYIFSLIQFYHEIDVWLFGGIFNVLARHEDRYEVQLAEIGIEFLGRLKLWSPYRGRTTRVYLESHYSSFEVQEILREPYSGRAFPGYDGINVSFVELEALVRNGRPDWKAALGSVSGIYLITDTKTGRRYVGSAYGEQGIWSRWSSYVENGHGGNIELRSLVIDPTLDYCRVNFRFALLETCPIRASDSAIIARENFWKEMLLTRSEHGLNRN
jgi:hypothetical protein